jgi:HPt (histidine-containing phosphotransfer) domain-containing protein
MLKAAADAEPFDVVLMDVQMPEMDGLTATRLIRTLPPPLGRVPVIALTAHASGSARADCLDAGMDGFVSKPVRLPAMLAELDRVLAAATLAAPPPPSARASQIGRPVQAAPAARAAAPAPQAAASAQAARSAPTGPFAQVGQTAQVMQAFPSPPVTEDPVIDAEQVAELTAAFSPEGWEELIASFTTSADIEIDRIAEALAAGESPRRPAHTLKGVAWNSGAQRLGNLAKRLETAPPFEAERLLAELRPLLRQSIAALNALTPSCAER